MLEIKISFSELGRKVSELKTENVSLSSAVNEIKLNLKEKEGAEKTIQHALSKLEVEKNTLQDKNGLLQDEVSTLKTEEKGLKENVNKEIQKYNTFSVKYEKKLDELEDKEIKKISQHNENLKSSWTQHQDKVKGAVKEISQRLGISYIPPEKFEFSGKPDNSVIIADEYVIFDAKSPANPEELSNFPSYLKQQSESAKKYAKHNGVKKDIYFVIPTNTLEAIERFYYEEVDYRVHIITIQSLESVLRSLFKIEEYKTITDLNPEDRENLCRIIGKLLHVSKRRIQVDAFFGTVLHEILKDSERMIPDEMQERINEYEASDKI